MPGKSAVQNINDICFSDNGLLRDEYPNLFQTLFKDYQKHEDIIKALTQKAKGITRDEIIHSTGLPNAGSTSRLLLELEESGFIRKYVPFGKKQRNSLYLLSESPVCKLQYRHGAVCRKTKAHK
ncbi:MAG: hypothetical protein K8R52_11535 [Bacteroidales bacterium]|nr:hypothetical protein [Bacteroidales bacterium]